MNHSNEFFAQGATQIPRFGMPGLIVCPHCNQAATDMRNLEVFDGSLQRCQFCFQPYRARDTREMRPAMPHFIGNNLRNFSGGPSTEQACSRPYPSEKAGSKEDLEEAKQGESVPRSNKSKLIKKTAKKQPAKTNNRAAARKKTAKKEKSNQPQTKAPAGLVRTRRAKREAKDREQAATAHSVNKNSRRSTRTAQANTNQTNQVIDLEGPEQQGPPHTPMFQQPPNPYMMPNPMFQNIPQPPVYQRAPPRTDSMPFEVPGQQQMFHSIPGMQSTITISGRGGFTNITTISHDLYGNMQTRTQTFHPEPNPAIRPGFSPGMMFNEDASLFFPPFRLPQMEQAMIGMMQNVSSMFGFPFLPMGPGPNLGAQERPQRRSLFPFDNFHEIFEHLFSGMDDGYSSAPEGMDEEDINGLDMVTFNNDAKSSSQCGDKSCVICLAEFEHGEKLRELPCKHRFHVGCIDQWLIQNGSCPICRDRVTAE